ncbi:MAG: phosphohydrolase [Treponema sp.]|nr:phosphohydrolase [Treponema sp.]
MPLSRISCSEITEGVSYSSPVFFDDGKNMFLAPHQAAKKYHVRALDRWKVPFLVTAGHKEAKSQNQAATKSIPEPEDDFLDVEEVEELEDL